LNIPSKGNCGKRRFGRDVVLIFAIKSELNLKQIALKGSCHLL